MSLVRKVVPDETKYYQALLQYSTDHLMVKTTMRNATSPTTRS